MPDPIWLRDHAAGDDLEAQGLVGAVVFFVDPAIVDDPDAKDVTTITLSYTFFPHAPEKPVAAVAEPVQDTNTL